MMRWRMGSLDSLTKTPQTSDVAYAPALRIPSADRPPLNRRLQTVQL